MVIGAEARPDTEVGAEAVLDMLRTEDALEGIAGALGYPRGAVVRDVDDQLDACQLEHVEAPAREQIERAPRDPLATGGGVDRVADLAFFRVAVELDEGREPELVARVVHDCEPGAAA